MSSSHLSVSGQSLPRVHSIASSETGLAIFLEYAGKVSELIAIRLFMKWGAFDAIPEDSTVTYADLAIKLNAEIDLTKRLAGVLIAAGILTHVENDQLAHTSQSKVFVSGNPMTILMQLIYDESIVSLIRLPEYFENYGRREPTDKDHTPFAFSNGQPGKTVWEIQNQDPERMKRFMQAMTLTESLMPFTGICSYEWVKEVAMREADRVLFVDVGGGKGHALKAIREENEFIDAQRCVLQDIAEVIESVEINQDEGLKSVKLMKHDFHLKQPVTGALIYYIRRCLHDYGDGVCIAILRHLADAMSRDSRLHIVEQVITDPPSQLMAITDLNVMDIGGKERTVAGFKKIVESAGLKIKAVHGQGGPAQVIECIRSWD